MGRKEGRAASVPLLGGHGGRTGCGPARRVGGRPASQPLRPLMRERLLYRICLQSGGGGGGGGHVGDGERQQIK
jgi:hypothetical protein